MDADGAASSTAHGHLNGRMYAAPDAPFGGYRQSGIGRELGRAGFEEFLEIKTIAEPARKVGSPTQAGRQLPGRKVT